jgi:hypothetical protein
LDAKRKYKPLVFDWEIRGVEVSERRANSEEKRLTSLKFLEIASASEWPTRAPWRPAEGGEPGEGANSHLQHQIGRKA